MDKVYVVTIREVLAGTLLVNEIYVYKNYNNAREHFKKAIIEYFNKNNIDDYNLEKDNDNELVSEDSFIAYDINNSKNEYIEININIKLIL